MTVTLLGHSLTGLSLAVVSLPRGQSLRWYALTSALFAAFACLPDFPAPGWGHDSYQVSHSVFVTALLAAMMAPLLLFPTINARIGWRVLSGWSIAWLSHMVLDSMYSHGNGIAIFWPFSDAHLVMSVSWFETLQLPARSAHNLRVFGIETMVYGAMLVSCVGARWALYRRHQLPDPAGGAHASSNNSP